MKFALFVFFCVILGGSVGVMTFMVVKTLVEIVMGKDHEDPL